jgi:tetratricopeptide (TPR) repeat protein
MAATVAYPLAKVAARRALQLDPALAEAHASLAFASFAFDRDWPQAESGFKRALQYNPGYATAHHWYGIYLSALGRFAESEAEFVRAKSLDPLSTSIRVSFGEMLYMARRYDEAIAELRPAHDLDPSAPGVYLFLARAYQQKGMLPEAVAEAQRGQRIAPQPILVAELARLAAAQGRRADALKALPDLISSPLSPIEIATVFAALGDADRAFEFLRRAERERSGALLWAKVDPALDSLRDDPRLAQLLRVLRLAQ